MRRIGIVNCNNWWKNSSGGLLPVATSSCPTGVEDIRRAYRMGGDGQDSRGASSEGTLLLNLFA